MILIENQMTSKTDHNWRILVQESGTNIQPMMTIITGSGTGHHFCLQKSNQYEKINITTITNKLI